MLSHFSCVRLFAALWTVTHQALLSIGFFRQECSSGLPCPPPGNLPDPGIKSKSLKSPGLAGRLLTTGATWETHLTDQVLSKSLFKTSQKVYLFQENNKGPPATVNTSVLVNMHKTRERNPTGTVSLCGNKRQISHTGNRRNLDFN